MKTIKPAEVKKYKTVEELLNEFGLDEDAVQEAYDEGLVDLEVLYEYWEALDAAEAMGMEE